MVARNKPFSRLGLIIKSGEEQAHRILLEITQLLSTFEVGLYVVGTLPPQSAKEDFRCIKEEEIGEYCDLLIIVGRGTAVFLRLAKKVLPNKEFPVLGNKIEAEWGFLADIAYKDMPNVLPQILKGGYMKRTAPLLEGPF